MKKLLVLSAILFAFIFYGVQSQNVAKQVSQITGTAYKNINGTAVDADGNSYVCGVFLNSTVNFSLSITLSSDFSNKEESYIAKYSNTGECEWALKIELENEYNTLHIYDIAVSDNGSIYIVGTYNVYEGEIDFGNDKVSTFTNNNVGFIVKYNTSGDCQWLQEIYGPNSTYTFARHIAVSELGSIYLTGTFTSDELHFNNDKSINISNGVTNLFLAKYDEDGDCQWAKAIVGNGNAWDFDLTTHTNENYEYLSIAGAFDSETLNFGNSKILSNTNARVNGFFGIFNGDNGNCTATVQVCGEKDAFVLSGVMANDGSYYISGSFGKSTTFYNTNGAAGISISSPIDNNDESFIAKYSASGTCEWARVISGTGYDDGITGLAINGNSIYAIATFLSPTLNFISPGKTESIDNPGSGISSYLAKYDTDGDYEWSVLVGGDGNDYFTGIDIDGDGNVYVGGFFNSPTLNIGSFTLTREGTYDGFVAKFGEEQFATLATLSATIQTNGVTRYTAISGAEVLDDGGAEVTERGVCIGRDRMPTIDDVDSKFPASEAGTGAFTVQIDGLSYGTKYYVRPYAINAVGVVYGTERSFTTAPGGGVAN